MRKTHIDYIFRELPLWFICTITSFLPDHPFFCKIRGWLSHPFFASCGKNFQFGSRVRFIRPSQINIGDNVYIAEGCWACGTGQGKRMSYQLVNHYIYLTRSNV